jgi:hypothetical protein
MGAYTITTIEMHLSFALTTASRAARTDFGINNDVGWID